MTRSLGQRTWVQELLTTSPWCHYCHEPVAREPTGRTNVRRATLDHIVPRSLGGSHGRINMVICCHTCNNKKGNQRHICWCAQCCNAFAYAATRKMADERCPYCTKYNVSYPHEHDETFNT